MLKVTLLTLLSATNVSATDYTSSEIKVMCENVGTWVASTSNDHMSWAQFNNPNKSHRLKLLYESDISYEQAFQTVANMLQKKHVPLDKEVAQQRVYKDTRPFIHSFVTYAVEALGVFDGALESAFEISQLLIKKDRTFQAAMMLGDVWVDVLSDPAYAMPLLKYSKFLLEIEKGILNLNESNDFKSDLLSFFMREGIPYSKALKMTWNILGLYGSQGAWGPVFSDSFVPNSALALSLKIIFNQISYLDTLTPNGRLYSLPSKIKVGCKIGRPYHFWMAAYLSHELSLQNYTSNQASRAAFELGLMYEYFSTTNGRSGFFFQDMNNKFSMDFNSKRITTVSRAMGAQYGVGLLKNANFEEGLALAMSSAQDPIFIEISNKTKLANPITRYINFARILAPWEIFEYYGGNAFFRY